MVEGSEYQPIRGRAGWVMTSASRRSDTTVKTPDWCCSGGLRRACRPCTSVYSGLQLCIAAVWVACLWRATLTLRARWGSMIPEVVLCPADTSAYLHPPPSLHQRVLMDSVLAEAWHAAYTTPSPSTQALSIKQHSEGAFRCVWTGGWELQPVQALFMGPLGVPDQAVPPQPCALFCHPWPLSLSRGVQVWRWQTEETDSHVWERK